MKTQGSYKTTHIIIVNKFSHLHVHGSSVLRLQKLWISWETVLFSTIIYYHLFFIIPSLLIDLDLQRLNSQQTKSSNKPLRFTTR